MAVVVLFQHIAGARQAAAEALLQAGHSVIVAREPDEAWSIVQAVTPDLVITNFPAFLNSGAGITLTEAIRASQGFWEIPILDLRAHSPPHFAEYAAEAGVTESIELPAIPQRLAEVVHRLLS